MVKFFYQRWLLTSSFTVLLILLSILVLNLGYLQRILLPVLEQQFAQGLFAIHGLETEKIVILTIDDGLSTKTTEILNLLAKFSAHATFFIHQKNTVEIDDYQEVIKKMINQGHELANHTTEDIASNSLSSAEFKKKFSQADLFLREFAIKPRFFRAAGGLYNYEMMTVLQENNSYYQKFIMASFLPWDTNLPFPKIYANQLIQAIFPGAIVVFHDGQQKGDSRLDRTFISLEKFLKVMAKKNYQVVSLGEAIKLIKSAKID